jgi:GNAT superfamily N-acetyltransferase
MDELARPVVINDIVVDGILLEGWPGIFSGCWMNISPLDEEEFDRTAELIHNNDYLEGSIVMSNKRYFPDCIATITWQKTGEIKFLWVKDEFRGNKIGYYLGIWLRTHLAKIGVRVLHKFIQERNDIVEEFLRKFKEEYGAEDIILRDDPIEKEGEGEVL